MSARWTPSEIDMLRRLIAEGASTVPEVAAKIGRSMDAVEQKMNRMGLSNDAAVKQRCIDAGERNAQIFTYYLAHGQYATMEHYGLSPLQLKWIRHWGYNSERFKGERRVPRWSYDEHIFYLQRAGLMTTSSVYRLMGRRTEKESPGATYLRIDFKRYHGETLPNACDMLRLPYERERSKLPHLEVRDRIGRVTRRIVPWCVLYPAYHETPWRSDIIDIELYALADFQRNLYGQETFEKTFERMKEITEEARRV